MDVPKYSAPKALMLRKVQQGRHGDTGGTWTDRSWKVMVKGVVLRWDVRDLADSSMNCSVGFFILPFRMMH